MRDTLVETKEPTEPELSLQITKALLVVLEGAVEVLTAVLPSLKHLQVRRFAGLLLVSTVRKGRKLHVFLFMFHTS